LLLLIVVCMCKGRSKIKQIVFIPLNTEAFLKFSASAMRRLFKGDVYFKITLLKITQNIYDKSFVNII